MKYLQEHVDSILGAIRHAGDLLHRDGASWETTAWVRSIADATRLWQMLREAVCEEPDVVKECTEVCVGLVRRKIPPGAEVRWGVLVRLARP